MTRRKYKRRPWSPTDMATLKRSYPDMATAKLATLLKRPIYSVYNVAFSLGLKKSAAYRFKTGLVPWNKGTHFVAGGRSIETRFKKGRKPQTWLPVGSEVVDSDGYRKRKVRDDARLGFTRRNWKFLHVLLWEEAYGPVPHGYAVIFINGLRADVRLDNLALVSRAELMRLNTIHNYPREIVQVMQLRGAIVRQINRKTNHEKTISSQ